jgi:hypothetical protein
MRGIIGVAALAGAFARLRRILGVAAVAAALAGPAGALAAAGPAPDAVLVEGSSWHRVLPAYAAMARPAPAGTAEAAELPPVLLWTQGEERWTLEQLERHGARRILEIGAAGEAPAALPGTRRIEAPDATVDEVLAATFFAGRRAPAVYLSDGVDYAAALAGAALAVAAGAPLLVADGDLPAAAATAGDLARRVGASEVVLLGAGLPGLEARAGLPLRTLSAPAALAAYNDRVRGTRHLVIAAPADAAGPFSPPRLSLAAVPYAVGRGAALAFAGAGAGGGRTPEEATAALEALGRGPFDAVTLVGDSLALPLRETADVDQLARGVARPRVHKVPAFVDPAGLAADRAVGRLAALDVFDLSRWVARLVHPPAGPASALLFANADDKFLLGEAISGATARELQNAGVNVDAYYRDAITPARIRSELPRHSLVIWEGHPRDLTLDDDALPAPEVGLPPATFFLQGCYTLDRSDPYVLVERGADAVIGTYMAVYSASGSAFAKAFLDGQLYRGETAGEALASARNYLLATVELRRRRGHDDWRKSLRAATSFDLWGDPTAPPELRPERPKVPPVRAELSGDRLVVRVPPRRLPPSTGGTYLADVRPNGQLSALNRKRKYGPERRLVELYFAEVRVPPALGPAPVVEGPYDPGLFAWVFAPRTRTLSLVVHEKALVDRERGGVLHFRLRPGR